MADISEIRALAEKTQSQLSGKFGFAFCDLNSGEECSINGGETFPIASAFKIFVLAELYRQAAAGMINLKEKIVCDEKFRSGGSGLLASLAPGTVLTVYDYAVLMMSISDNTATNIIFDRIGGRDAIRRNVLEPLGLNCTHVDFNCTELMNKYYCITPDMSPEQVNARSANGTDRNNPWFTCEMGEGNWSSPKDMTVMLRTLFEGRWVDKETSDAVLAVMRTCQNSSRITKYLPYSAKTAHKTGSLDRVMTDAGVIVTSKGAYTFTFFYNGNTASAEEYDAAYKNFRSEELCALLSKSIFDVYMNS
ncbi:MAG: serine hydrolase [Eubacteriales bacterium]|nr:serine hydrolase [Eubacteriales bacterium]